MSAHIYNIDTTWLNGRKGLILSPEVTGPRYDGGSIEVATPPQFAKGIPGIWSPEHLLTAAVSSCFMTTFLAIAENMKLEFTAFTCRAEGKLELVDNAWLVTEVILRPSVTIADQSKMQLAGKVLQKAERGCLISNSIKSTVTMLPTIEVSEELSVLATR